MAAVVKVFARYLGAIVFACGIATAAPLAAAPVSTGSPPPEDRVDEPAVAVQQVPVPFAGIRDEAAMVIVGAALIGIAAAVRRAA